jgi:hypothetical protein
MDPGGTVSSIVTDREELKCFVEIHGTATRSAQKVMKAAATIPRCDEAWLRRPQDVSLPDSRMRISGPWVPEPGMGCILTQWDGEW